MSTKQVERVTIVDETLDRETTFTGDECDVRESDGALLLDRQTHRDRGRPFGKTTHPDVEVVASFYEDDHRNEEFKEWTEAGGVERVGYTAQHIVVRFENEL